MSEDFLTRWSRRKRQADPAAADAPAPRASAEGAGAAPRDGDASPASQAEVPIAEVDLSKLPPLESITAGTDIRAFLAAGVPEALKRAALSRAWAADPAIRDFVGLSENAWDFTAPGGVPGFAPMVPTDDVARMAEGITRNMELPRRPIEEAGAPSRPSISAHKTGAFESSSVDRRSHSEATTEGSTAKEPNPSVSVASTDAISAGGEKVIDIASQNEAAPEPHPVRRGHGGALPQ